MTCKCSTATHTPSAIQSSMCCSPRLHSRLTRQAKPLDHTRPLGLHPLAPPRCSRPSAPAAKRPNILTSKKAPNAHLSLSQVFGVDMLLFSLMIPVVALGCHISAQFLRLSGRVTASAQFHSIAHELSHFSTLEVMAMHPSSSA